jgi:hypothetical protein
MMMMRKSWLLPLCLALAASGAGGESLTATAFRYKGGELSYVDQDQVYAVWNAADASSVNKPGMKVMFWGRAEGCDLRAENGPVTDKGNPKFDQALELTGVAAGKGKRWAPSANSDQCDAAVRQNVGRSFVHVNEDAANGGVGIFTFTGPDSDGQRSFFRQYDHSGKQGKGYNADIEGTFVHFRFDWKKSTAVRPWAGDAAAADQRKAAFVTVQSVPAVSMGSGERGKSKSPTQAKQQTMAAFINRACFEAQHGKRGLCQLQYLFNTALYRAEPTDWNAPKWSKNGDLLIDPGQKGMPVIHGLLGRRGESMTEASSGMPLFTSQGEPTQHEAFRDKEFRVEVSFAQLKNALRLIAARTLHKEPAEVADADVASLIGPSWNDPNEWALISLAVAQEVHNPHDESTVYIGGSFKELDIEPASM